MLSAIRRWNSGAGGVSGRTSGRECIWMPGYGDYGTSGDYQRLYFPNTFIPHSQNPKINRFNGIGMGLARYRLQIFDQYGNKIWETRALENGRPSEGWDGCNLKGERMPQGMYIWRAEAIFGDAEVWTGDNNESGVPETTQGTVLLLRE